MASNNNFVNCPALMSDGRAFTDYRPACEVNNAMRSQVNSNNSIDYRNFLIQNAETLMSHQDAAVKKKNDCVDCQKTPMGNQLKSCDDGTCSVGGSIPAAIMSELGSEIKTQGLPYTEESKSEVSGFNL